MFGVKLATRYDGGGVRSVYMKQLSNPINASVAFGCLTDP